MIMEGRAALWLVAGPLLALKLWATVLLLFFEPTRHALLGVLATTWPWAVWLVLLLAGPGLAWYRLVRVRRRRLQLHRSEWMLDPPIPQAPEPQWPEWLTVVRATSDR